MKRLSFFLVLVLFLALLSGCSGSDTSLPSDHAQATSPGYVTPAPQNTQSGDSSGSGNSSSDSSSGSHRTVTLGSYEQDNNSGNGKEPIEWIVIRTDGGRMLLLSKYALEAMPFDSEGGRSWESSSLRSWLNGEFYSSAFSSSEAARIIPTELNDEKNHTTTTDKVFLLGSGDVDSFTFALNPDLGLCQPTAYASSKFIRTIGGYSPWWLRTLAQYSVAFSNTIFYVDAYGELSSERNGMASGAPDIGVRPAIWVEFGN